MSHDRSLAPTTRPGSVLEPAELRYQSRCQIARSLLDALEHVHPSDLLSALLACERAFMQQEGTMVPAPAHAKLEATIRGLLDTVTL